MASPENLASLDQWNFRPTFADSWISEAFARDTETMTRALKKSLSDHSETAAMASSETFSPFLNLLNETSTGPAQTTSVSSSDADNGAPKRRNPIPVSKPAVKRKSRASKRTTTTFIMADPANFRQMVQQVTGVRFGGDHHHLSVNQVLKPEPHRPANRFQGCLPTLDTSAFLLSHLQQQREVGPTSPAMMIPAPANSQPSLMTGPPPALMGDVGGGFDFDSFSSFPTLESWKVV